MSFHVRWAQGGTALVLRLSADSIALRSTVSWPPGSRVEGVGVEDERTRLRVKVHACHREPEGEFLVEGRPLDLTRETREKMTRSIEP